MSTISNQKLRLVSLWKVFVNEDIKHSRKKSLVSFIENASSLQLMAFITENNIVPSNEAENNKEEIVDEFANVEEGIKDKLEKLKGMFGKIQIHSKEGVKKN